MSMSYLMPLEQLESLLSGLYADEHLSDTMREVRANMARAYHDRTGRHFAARYY